MFALSKIRTSPYKICLFIGALACAGAQAAPKAKPAPKPADTGVPPDWKITKVYDAEGNSNKRYFAFSFVDYVYGKSMQVNYRMDGTIAAGNRLRKDPFKTQVEHLRSASDPWNYITYEINRVLVYEEPGDKALKNKIYGIQLKKQTAPSLSDFFAHSNYDDKRTQEIQDAYDAFVKSLERSPILLFKINYGIPGAGGKLEEETYAQQNDLLATMGNDQAYTATLVYQLQAKQTIVRLGQFTALSNLRDIPTNPNCFSIDQPTTQAAKAVGVQIADKSLQLLQQARKGLINSPAMMGIDFQAIINQWK